MAINGKSYLNPFTPSENDIILSRIRTECLKLFDRGLPPWRNRQDTRIDNVLSGIVTRTKDPIDTVVKLDKFIDEVYKKHKQEFAYEDLSTSGGHKFLNKWSSDGFELLCLEHPRVSADDDKKSPDVDFWIDGQLPMDLKITIWPEKRNPKELRIKESLNRESSGKLIEHLYLSQGAHRWGWQNKLFVVCYDADKGEHLKLKVDFDRMRQIIKNYFDRFSISQMHEISQLKLLGQIRNTNWRGRPVQAVALADVIWNYREPPFLARIRPSLPPMGPTEQPSLF